MATLADSLVSSSARKLPVRKRPDLSATRHRYHGRVYWVVKEPVSLSYYRFQEEEYAILNMLDGETSLDDLKDQFEAEFPPQKITVEELQQYIVMLHKRGLIITDAAGQGGPLLERRGERLRQELLAKFTNVLSIRFRGIDPDRLLNWLHARLWWVYSPVTVSLCCLLALSALMLVAVQFDVFRAKLPAFHQFFTLKNAAWLAIAMGATKVVHEFGHGLTCKHFGGECHEMGVMLLVLTPCLYCNVSDSWMLPSKWQRAMIGAGGMYVELVMASACTFIWWFSEPGMLNQLALSTMFVCSVSTVMFNGNPLLRYDGYYILSDLIEIPNLRQKAGEILSRKLGHWCLGIKPTDNPFLPERQQALFALYSVAAVVYSWVVVFSILWFLYKVMQPYRLEIIGQIIGITALYGLLVQPLWKLYKYLSIPGRLDQVKKPRLYASIAIVTAAILAVLFVPLPYRIFCPLEIEPRDAATVHVVVPGRLEEVLVKPGQHVEAGQPLVRLSNPDLLLEIAELEGKRDQLKAQSDGLSLQRHDDSSVVPHIATVNDALETTEGLLRQKQDDLKRLVLVAPKAGIVLPPPEVPHKTEPEGQLPQWWGTPLEERNQGVFLGPSTPVCLIGDPQQMQAALVVDQTAVDFVAVGQDVFIKLDELPFVTLTSRIEEKAESELKVAPRHLSSKAGGELATKTDESGVDRPWNPSFQALAYPLEDPQSLMRIGLRGRAKIDAGWQTLGQRLWRYVSETFNFKL
jgi:putative peptide zinc metalloprotease protein